MVQHYQWTNSSKKNQKEDHFSEPLFKNEEEKINFLKRHELPKIQVKEYEKNTTLKAYLGIDAGSTTSKFVLINEQEEIIDSYYSNNQGSPLDVVRKALINLNKKYEDKQIKLEILGVGATGYGELLFAKAFKTDYHTVETLAHAKAAMKYSKDVSFILDIGGQDMKAITITNNIITTITLNEACSAGCGSFIETFADNFKIPVEKIAEHAFLAKQPSRLGSRCTVFMNSSVITEQKNGKTQEDILAGLCRSVVENVFTKVLRVNNLDELGKNIVVQGGTFKNDAVLKAFEDYTQKEVIRAPYPGEMGAIGIALLTKEHMEKTNNQSTFSINNLHDFTYETSSNHICSFCTNQCNRSIITFNDDSTFVTGNRCERGEIIGDIKDKETREKLKEVNQKMNSVPDLITYREQQLFKKRITKKISENKNTTIGIPRMLEFWSSMPFWTTFFETLGFNTTYSDKSSEELYEKGISSIPSDTVCFPAKIAHGHTLNLVEKKVDIIFIPQMLKTPSENKEKSSVHLCAVVQGYSMVLKENIDEIKHNKIKYESPVFQWYDKISRNKQLIDYMKKTFNLNKKEILQAIILAEKSMNEFNEDLQKKGNEVIESLKNTNKFAVVLAGRPYHSDPLVNHHLSKFFIKENIPILTIDSLPNIHETDISKTRAENYVNYHNRMLSSAIYTANNPNLEFVQIVSFGCGHDAVLSDEATRIFKEISSKEPLILKLDETDVKGPLNIRIKSFISTIKKRREQKPSQPKELKEPFDVKFTKEDKDKTILIPNLSKGFCEISAASLKKIGFNAKPLPLADAKAIELGKKYTHNDICYPAQINVGEILTELKTDSCNKNKTAVILGKDCTDCRAGQYAVIARKALDNAGYKNIPILTTGEDTKNMHPGFNFNIKMSISMAWGIAILDQLEEMKRRIRPYEVNPGQTNKVFDEEIKNVSKHLETSTTKACKHLETSIQRFNNIPIHENMKRKPRTFIIGEILLNYHETSNNNLEAYLEKNGMETILPPMIPFFKQKHYRKQEEADRFFVKHPFIDVISSKISEKYIEKVSKKMNKLMHNFKFYEANHLSLKELSEEVKHIVDNTFTVGEGWKLPAEIITQAKTGVKSFIIVQPFGCLPNHITGRGLMKVVKKDLPDIQILPLDYDPDTAFANVENRLQMLIMNARELESKT
jgi:predicted CoA-substrate-specific enzyme activase